MMVVVVMMWMMMIIIISAQYRIIKMLQQVARTFNTGL
jgi:hypothetical protein